MNSVSTQFTISKFNGFSICNGTEKPAAIVRQIPNKRFLNTWISKKKDVNGSYLIKSQTEFDGSKQELYTDGSVVQKNKEGDVVKRDIVDLDLLEEAVYKYKVKLYPISINNLLKNSENRKKNAEQGELFK